MKRLFRQIADDDMEIDAYKLQGVLNAMFKEGTYGCHWTCLTAEIEN